MQIADPEFVSQPPPAATSVRANGAPAPEFRSVGFYRQALKPQLPAHIFEPNSLRLVWFSGAFLAALAGFATVVTVNPIWPLKLLLGLFIGCCTGSLGFISHELFHGSITKNQRLQNVFGIFGTLAFFMSPTYWKFSHNRAHHGKAQQLVKDPDAFPILRIYRTSKYMKFMFPFTPGSGHKRSAFYFFFWFSFHNLATQLYFRYKSRTFEGLDHRRVNIEMAFQAAIIVALAWWAGPQNWLWVFVIPFFVQNYMLMSYISTNHNLSPLTSENDPLVNTLSVTNHRWLEFLHFNFGYHVEHHIFPTVNGKHVKAIHHALVEKFPESYKVMPKGDAMRALYKTARIYKNSRELIHPNTLEVFDTV